MLIALLLYRWRVGTGSVVAHAEQWVWSVASQRVWEELIWASECACVGACASTFCAPLTGTATPGIPRPEHEHQALSFYLSLARTNPQISTVTARGVSFLIHQLPGLDLDHFTPRRTTPLTLEALQVASICRGT